MYRTQSHTSCLRLRWACLPALILAALTHQVSAAAAPAAHAPEDVSFDADFFPAGTAPKVDLSRFSRSDAALAGNYRGDIMVNRIWQMRQDIVLRDVDGQDSAQPCYTAKLLGELGVDLASVAADKANPAAKPIPAGTFCDVIGDYIPGATASFDLSEQSLSLTIPQIYTVRSARGYVDPSQWDAGITALTSSYMANVYRSQGQADNATRGYVGMNTALNLGSWHLRHQGALNWSSATGRKYQANSTFAQHDIPQLQAQMIAGDTFTPGVMFDSVRMRGLRVTTDDRMLPQSMRGFAPTVRGVADTNARVVVRQRGYIVSETSVAPGAFAIDDLYSTGYGGDLDVEINEADGRVRRFVVPFSAVPMLLRPGQQRWDLATGRVQEQDLSAQPFFLQGTYQRGLSNRVTGYAGGTVANGYRAALVGAALNTSVGAFSLDATRSRNQAPGQSATQGTSLRLGYNKNFVNTGTDFALAAYRYSTEGYVGFRDSVVIRNLAAGGVDGSILSRERSRLSANINQRLGESGGQLYLSGAVREYWGGGQRQVDFSAGYSNRFRDLSYSLSAQRTLDTGVRGRPMLDRIPGAEDAADASVLGRRDTRLMLSFSLPLGRGVQTPQLIAMADRDSSGNRSARATVTGQVGEDNRYSYNGSLGRTNGSNALDLSSQRVGSSVNLGAGYSRGSGYQQVNGSANGSVVVHGGGWTFTPPLGETVGLVHAPDAAGARVEGGQGSVVDSRGYAVVANLQPYELNTVTLDPKGTSTHVELKATTQRVAPRAGTVVKLTYETVTGRAAIIDTKLADGRPVPFGADIFDAQGQSVGVAGQASRLMVRDMPSSGALVVKWGQASNEQCRVSVALPPQTKSQATDVERYDAPCLPVGDPTAAVNRYPGVYGSPGFERIHSLRMRTTA